MNDSLDARIAEAWNDPDALNAIVGEALRNGQAGRIQGAAERLFRTDPDAQRRYSTYAIALAKNGLLSESERLLERFEELYGSSTVLELCRADVAREGNRYGKAEGHEDAALQLAPNDPAALQRVVDRLPPAGDRVAARRGALREVARRDDAWLARLWLGSMLIEELDVEQAERLFAEARDRAPGDPRVIAYAAAAFSGAGLHEPALQMLRDTSMTAEQPALALAALHAASAGGAESDPKWLAVLSDHQEYADAIRFYSQPATEEVEERGPEGLTEGYEETAPTVGGALLRAITALARTETHRYRQNCYRVLLESELQAAVLRPHLVVTADLSFDEESLRLRLATRVNQFGQGVAVAFSDATGRRKWRTSSPTMTLQARELCAIAVAQKLPLAINPAGPSSLELDLSELELLSRGELPEPSESDLADRRSYYLFEPFEQLPAERGQLLVKEQLALRREVIEGYLLQTVDEKRGTALSVAIRFREDVPSLERADIVSDLNDPLRNAALARHIRFFELEDDALLPVVRKVGVWLIDA